jgi:hypothetical protein
MGATFDAAGHMIECDPWLGSYSYDYDDAGRRVSKTDPWGDAPTIYLYDGANLICEIDAGSGNVSVAYTWGAAGLISDHYTGTNQSYFHLYDASDNTRELLGSDGSIQAEFVYSSFGETQQDTAPNGQSAISTPFSWKGRSGAYRDWESD